MPLYRSSAIDAIALRKANPNSFWGTRESINRVEPLATPQFDFDFALEPGDRIFTIGSCFARNVEAKLALAGYRLPMRDLLARREFAGVDPKVLNNFSTPSIWNELSWAVGEQMFDPDSAIVEYTPGKWIDLNLNANVRPTSRERVLAQREAIASAYRQFAECKLVIVTLGLVEVWFDRDSGHYLNAIPPPPIVRRFPERFELHVLDYAETLDYCERAIDILRRHGRADAAILISVSPVALGVTHRPGDVMVANCYSKSVLRAVTEHVVARHPNVYYFPSYESATLSDRRAAWANDFTHVTEALVAHNVDRLVRDLTAAGAAHNDDETVREEIAANGSAAAYRHAVEVRKGDPAAADRFFSEFGEWSEKSPTFATEHVEWLVAQRRAEEAIATAKSAGTHNERLDLAVARAQLLAKRPADALAVLNGPICANSRAGKYWAMRTEAEGKIGDRQALEATLQRWCAALPKKASIARLHVARALLELSSPDRALELIGLALTEDGTLALGHILAAEAHLMRGDVAAAYVSFSAADPQTPSETRRYLKIKPRFDEAVAA
jgi:hypothetical protein